MKNKDDYFSIPAFIPSLHECLWLGTFSRYFSFRSLHNLIRVQKHGTAFAGLPDKAQSAAIATKSCHFGRVQGLA